MDAPEFEVRKASGRFTPQNYAGLYDRLVRNSAEPETTNGCWVWAGMVKNRYPRLNIRTPDGQHREIRAHRAMAVLIEIMQHGDESALFWDLYYLYSIAEFESDHLCDTALCIAPDHLRLLTKDDHIEETKRRAQGVYRRYRDAEEEED